MPLRKRLQRGIKSAGLARKQQATSTTPTPPPPAQAAPPPGPLPSGPQAITPRDRGASRPQASPFPAAAQRSPAAPAQEGGQPPPLPGAVNRLPLQAAPPAQMQAQARVPGLGNLSARNPFLGSRQPGALGREGGLLEGGFGFGQQGEGFDPTQLFEMLFGRRR